MTVRTTVHLDEGLLERVRQLVPERGLSRFVSEALEARLATLERQGLEEEMREGYLAAKAERDALNADWHVVDFEDWPC